MQLEDELKEEAAGVRRLALLRGELLSTQRDLDRANEISDLVSRFSKVNLVIPKWLRNSTGKKGKRAIATLQLSDTHFDEVISSPQIAEIGRASCRERV